MAKRRRGRPKKDPAEVKASQVGVRMSDELIARLRRSAAARTPPLSLSSEAGYRLEKSLKSLELDASKTRAFFLEVAAVGEIVETRAGARWWADKFSFRQVKAAALAAFDVIEAGLPKGREVNREKVCGRDLGRETMLMRLYSLDLLAGEDPGKRQPIEVNRDVRDADAAHGEQVHASSLLATLIPDGAPMALLAKGRRRRD